MKYYFNFYNIEGKENNYIYDSNKDSYYNINLDFFNLKIFINDINIQHDRITDYKFLVEKEVDGVYTIESSFIGKKQEDIIKFEKCKLNKDELDKTNIKYRCYIECYEGGILVYTEIKKPIHIYLKTICDDFNITIDNSNNIGDCYELQDEDIERIKFTIDVVDGQEHNTLKYYYSFNSKEEIEPKNFNILGVKNKTFIYEVLTNIFVDNATYLHFYLKDSFNNIRYKKYKLVTKNNNKEILEIIDYTHEIYDENTNLSFFYNSKNIESVRPEIYIEYSESLKYSKISDKSIGLRGNNINKIVFKLIDHFNDISEKLENSSKISINFNLNTGSKKSNSVEMIYDNLPPKILLTNIQDNYLVIRDDLSLFKVEGHIYDKNLFYIGKGKKKYDFEGIDYHVLIKSEKDIMYLKEKNTIHKIQKYGDIYVANISTNEYELYDTDNNKIEEYEYLDDFSEDYNIVFLALDINKFSTYEKNIIFHNKLLVKEIDTNHIVKQDQIIIDNFIIFKIYIEKEFKEILNIDLGINEYEYSFLKYLDRTLTSCYVDFNKNLNINFNTSKLLFSNIVEDSIIYKFSSNKINEYKNFVKLENFAILLMSLSENEYFSSSSEIYFTDNELNLKEIADIYYIPELKIENIPELSFKYNLELFEEGKYNFNIEVPVQKGINNYKLLFEDVLENEEELEFEIEKQIEKIKIKLDENYSKDIVFNDNNQLFSNKETLMLKLLIENETKIDKEKNQYIIFNKNNYTKYKIIRDRNSSYSIVEFYNLKEIQDYEVYYSNDTTPSFKFTINILENMYLDAPENIVTGNDCYYLKFNTNIFSIVNFSFDNHNSFNCSMFKNEGIERIIKIQRNNNNTIVEKLNLTISIYDPKNIFKTLNKEISLTFYTDNLISEYWIPNNFLNNNNELNSASFDLCLKTFQKNSINNIYYYDELEMDFYKRKKYAIYDEINNNYIIKDIVSPIEYSDIVINLNIDNEENLNITKTLFSNNPIKLIETFHAVSIVYLYENENIIFRLKNHLKTKEQFKKFEAFANFQSFYSTNDITLNPNEEFEIIIPNNKLYGKVIFNSSLINNKNKIINLDSENLIINLNKIDGYIKELNTYNIFNSNEKFEFNFITNYDNEFELHIKDPFLNVEIVNLKKGKNKIDLSKQGIYYLELYGIVCNKKSIISNYYILISDYYFDNIKLKNTSFTKWKFINEMIITNNIMYDSDILSPKIIYFLNGVKMKEYNFFKKENENYYFIVDKKNGLNEYIYNDNFIEKKICEFNTNDCFNNNYSLYDIHTNEESALYINENSIFIETKCNLYLKTKGIKFIDVYPNNSNKKFRKIVLEEKETVILSGFIPCKIKCYDKNENEIPKCNYEIKLNK